MKSDPLVFLLGSVSEAILNEGWKSHGTDKAFLIFEKVGLECEIVGRPYLI